MTFSDKPYDDANALLMGGSTSAKFDTVGDKVVGIIAEPPTTEQERDLDSREPKTWSDGQPKMQVIVVLQTDESDPENPSDDGRRRLYVRANLRNAIRDAVRRAGASGLAVGGKLEVTYVGDGEASKRGWNPPKQYGAVYTPPETAAANAALGVTPAAAPAGASGVVLDADQVAALKAMGVNVG